MELKNLGLKWRKERGAFLLYCHFSSLFRKISCVQSNFHLCHYILKEVLPYRQLSFLTVNSPSTIKCASAGDPIDPMLLSPQLTQRSLEKSACILIETPLSSFQVLPLRPYTWPYLGNFNSPCPFPPVSYSLFSLILPIVIAIANRSGTFKRRKRRTQLRESPGPYPSISSGRYL